MNGNDTFLDINNAHLRVNNGNVQASTFVLDQIDFIASSNASTTVGFNNPTTAFLATSNIEVGTANLFVDTSTSNVGIGTDAPLDTLHINGGTLIGGHILPTQHQQFDIGSAERKIRHLFLSDNSLWLGDETRITFSGGKMKFRRRKKNILPRGLRTIGIAAGHANEAATRTAALAHAGKTDITEMKLEHWVKYAKTLDATKDISDVFTEEADDYEATTASEAFKEIGDDIFSSHNVAIGKSTAPTSALDVVGTVKATAFEGDGSALTGIVAGQWTESSGDIQRSSGNVGIGKAPDSGKKLDVNGTVKATAFEGDGSALTGIVSGQWTYTAGASVGTQQLVFDDQAPGTTFTGTLSGNANNTAIRDTSNRYIRVTQGGTSRIGSVYWQTTLTNNWEATFEIYILPINYGGADDMRFIFYATNPITTNDGPTGTNGHNGAYMRWEYYNSDYVELYDHTGTAVVSSSASLQMNGWMPVTVTFNNGQLTSTIRNSSGTTLKTTTYDFGTTYSARYNTPTYVAVTGRSGGVQAEDRVRNITINALNVQTDDKLTRMNTNIGIDVASPTQKLDVAGTVKATAFEGDGSALTGITSGQWTDSGGNIYRSSGNVGIGIDPSSNAKFQVSGGKVIFGDQGGYGAAAQDAQVTIGGTHNSSTYYNTNGQVKLLITGGDNDSYSPYYIKCEDENGKDQFYIKGATSDGGSNGILYSRNNVGIGTTTARAGLHAYVQYPIFGKTNTGSGLICDDIGYAKWRQSCGSYHLTFARHNSSSSTNYTSWTSRGYLHKDYGNTRLNFTGQHRTFIGDVPFTQAESKEGLIVSANSDTYIKMSDGIAYGANAITINECLPVVTLSQTSNDKACFGVISLSEDPETREDAFGTFVSVAEKEKGDTRVFINSVGEGGIWITNKNGTLESGDYVTTSTIPGYGVKQEDDILHNYTVAKMTMNCDFNPTLQKVKRIKKKLVDVQYWVHVSNVTVTKEQYDELQPEFRRIIQDADGNDIYQTNDRTEWTHDPVEEDGIETYTEIRNELQNELDEHGQIQWEDTDDFEKAYKIRYILPDATQISESEYDAKIAAGEEAYKAAFVGCTYHCG